MNPRLAGFSREAVMKFGKVGRPAKDPVGERLRIYRAAGPLILERGVRGTTIGAVARAACLSPGGIYHYFTSKRQLVLYGLEPQALSRACMEEAAELHDALASARRSDLAEVIGLYVEKNVRMLEFVRPALHAAVELGRPELRRRLSAGIKEDADHLVSALRSLHPDATQQTAEESANAIRRTILGLAVHETVTAAEARRQLLWLFRQLLRWSRVSDGHGSGGSMVSVRDLQYLRVSGRDESGLARG